MKLVDGNKAIEILQDELDLYSDSSDCCEQLVAHILTRVILEVKDIHEIPLSLPN